MSNMIKATCPGCGQSLKLPDVPGLKDAVVECPICHYRAVGAVYLNGAANVSTQGTGTDENTLLRDDRPTKLVTTSGTPAQLRLKVVATGETFDLREGSNVIGRRAVSGTADIQIGNDAYMSRRHVQIDVVPKAGAFEYSLVEINSKNIVKLNGTAISRGDVIILSPGDTLTLGITDVRLDPVDNERTRLI